MIRRFVNSAIKFRTFTNNGKATFFQQQNFDRTKDYYLTLGVSKNASDSQIKNAYYKLAKQYHPDVYKGQDTKFKQISEAYQVLSDADKRRAYDSSRVFGDFASGVKGKASQGSYNYQEYQQYYQSMSAEQRQQIRRQTMGRMRNLALYSLGFITLWILFTRRPVTQYTEVNGNLVPVVMPMMYPPNAGYPQQMHQQPAYNYGSPYAQAVPAYSYNPNPSQGGYQHQYYPTRSQNQYQPGTMQSNYAPQS